MSYSYQPRDPQLEAAQVAVKWVAAMRVTGHAPNRDIVFADDSTTTAPHIHGFLVDDRRPQASAERYLVLEDGDVLRAPEETWLAEPSDELVTLFAKALGRRAHGRLRVAGRRRRRARSACPTVAGSVVPTTARSVAAIS